MITTYVPEIQTEMNYITDLSTGLGTSIYVMNGMITNPSTV